MGFIEWDQEDQQIERGPNYDEIIPLLELLVEHENELPRRLALTPRNDGRFI